MLNLLKKFVKEEDGATIIEYILLLAVVAGIVLISSKSLRGAIGGWFADMFGNVDDGLKNDEFDYTCTASSTLPECT